MLVQKPSHGEYSVYRLFELGKREMCLVKMRDVPC
jgi:hypothetical protein